MTHRVTTTWSRASNYLQKAGKSKVKAFSPINNPPAPPILTFEPRLTNRDLAWTTPTRRQITKPETLQSLEIPPHPDDPDIESSPLSLQLFTASRYTKEEEQKSISGSFLPPVHESLIPFLFSLQRTQLSTFLFLPRIDGRERTVWRFFDCLMDVERIWREQGGEAKGKEWKAVLRGA